MINAAHAYITVRTAQYPSRNGVRDKTKESRSKERKFQKYSPQICYNSNVKS
jgi:hypothetical protein